LNQEIHVEITRLANNPVLLNIWTTPHANIFRARAVANYDARRSTESVDEHEAFMALLRMRDAPRLPQPRARTRERPEMPFS